MTDPTQYRVAYLDSIHVTTSPSTALTDANQIEDLKTFTVTIANKTVEVQRIAKVWSRWVPTGQSASGTLAGTCVKGSATQALLKAAVLNMSYIYVHCIDDADAASGDQKGTMYRLLLESSEEPHGAGEVITFSYPFKVDDAPVPILAT